MPPVPSVPGVKLVSALEKHGFKVARIKGGHHVMRHPDGRGTTVPVHTIRNVAKGTLRGILRDVGLTVEELDLWAPLGQAHGGPSLWRGAIRGAKWSQLPVLRRALGSALWLFALVVAR